MDEEVIPVLRVSDAAVAAAWYQRLGFAQEWEHRFEPGFPAFVSVARGGVRLFLSEHTGDARPDTLICLRLRDIDAIAEEFGAAVEQMPWGAEVWLRDPDGNRLRVGMTTDLLTAHRGPRCARPWNAEGHSRRESAPDAGPPRAACLRQTARLVQGEPSLL